MNVFIIAAVSADGFIGRSAEHSSLQWRSKEDGQFFTAKTREAGVMIMGATTFKTFRLKRAPPGRRLVVYTRHPDDVSSEGVEATCDDPAMLLERLKQDGFTSVAICGGAMINSLFLNAGLITDMYLTVEPILFGAGIPLLSEPCDVRLMLHESTALNDNTRLQHYTVSR